MQAVVLLADSALVDTSNKVHALGLGWSITSTPTPPAALVVFVKVPWTATNVPHSFALRLVDQDGQPVVAGENPTSGEPAPLMAEGTFEVGRPPGLSPGMAIDQPIVLPLTRGWRCRQARYTNGDWKSTVTMRRAGLRSSLSGASDETTARTHRRCGPSWRAVGQSSSGWS